MKKETKDLLYIQATKSREQFNELINIMKRAELEDKTEVLIFILIEIIAYEDYLLTPFPVKERKKLIEIANKVNKAAKEEYIKQNLH